MNVVVRSLLLLFLCLSVQARAVFVIGDLHADIDALKRILVGLSLIDKYDNWIGGDAELVTVGDHLDRGTNSRAVLDLLMKLESQAPNVGGKVTNLIGNHEYITIKGHYTYAHFEDVSRYRDFKMGVRGNGYEHAFVGSTVYAEWFRSRPAIYKSGDTLFVHAGLSEKMLDHSIEEINLMFLNWMKYDQGIGPKPDSSTEWVVSMEGPLWNRNLNFLAEIYKKTQLNKHAISPTLLDRILSHFEVKRVAAGHTPIADLIHTVDHPFYGERVISVDTGISAADGNFVTGFKIENGIVTGYHFERKFQKLIKTFHSKEGSRGNNCMRFY